MGNTNVPHQPVSNLSANSTITVRPFPPIIIGPLTLPNTLRNERSETNGKCFIGLAQIAASNVLGGFL